MTLATTQPPIRVCFDVKWNRQPDYAEFSKMQAVKIDLPKLSDDDAPYERLFAEVAKKHPGRQLHFVQSERTFFLEVAVMPSGAVLAHYARKYRNNKELMLYVL